MLAWLPRCSASWSGSQGGIRWRAVVAVLGMVCAGCLNTRVVHLENLEVALPAPEPRGWGANIGALLDTYAQAPVLAPEDERLVPLYGGLTTLAYYGADAQSRARDQQLAPGMRTRAQSLATACDAANGAESELMLQTVGVPAFVPVWVSLSRRGESSPGAGCDEHGRPLGDGDERFCMFGRLALQPVPGRDLIVVVHGLFDSGAQSYVQQLAAALYRLGHSVLLPDMRDHGETLRAAPDLATTLGTLEGPDLLAVGRAVRHACGPRVGRAGAVGVSGGGLAAIRAFALDQNAELDAGVIALSPLLDVDAAIDDLSQTGPCLLTRSFEIGWQDDLAIAGFTGTVAFGAAATVQAMEGRAIDGHTALAGAIGAGVGLLGALAVDAWFDGTEPCVAEHAIAGMVESALRVRWRALRAAGSALTMSPAGRRIDPESITADDYVRERAKFLAARLGVSVGRFDAPGLARSLRRALEPSERRDARLLVLGAQDDPVTRRAALDDFVERTRGLAQVYSRAMRQGGHGAMWIVQPHVMQEVFARFFEVTPKP